MKTLIYGTRTFADMDTVREIVNALPDDTLLLVDGTLGVSNFAKNTASFRGIPTKHFPANFKMHGKQAPLIVNRRMIDECDEAYFFCDYFTDEIKETLTYAMSAKKFKRLFVSSNVDFPDLPLDNIE